MIPVISGIYRSGARPLSRENRHCHACGKERPVDEIVSFRWAHLYYLPLIPLGTCRERICLICGGDPDEGNPRQIMREKVVLLALLAAGLGFLLWNYGLPRTAGQGAITGFLALFLVLLVRDIRHDLDPARPANPTPGIGWQMGLLRWSWMINLALIGGIFFLSTRKPGGLALNLIGLPLWGLAGFYWWKFAGREVPRVLPRLSTVNAPVQGADPRYRSLDAYLLPLILVWSVFAMWGLMIVGADMPWF
ncbi:MAG: hypothetical protein GX442_21820 [Candidatus Riflebacteria bacterium]|nr:hypothetical protein [Candidatus Riflebacteria bacterium]